MPNEVRFSAPPCEGPSRRTVPASASPRPKPDRPLLPPLPPPRFRPFPRMGRGMLHRGPTDSFLPVACRPRGARALSPELLREHAASRALILEVAAAEQSGSLQQTEKNNALSPRLSRENKKNVAPASGLPFLFFWTGPASGPAFKTLLRIESHKHHARVWRSPPGPLARGARRGVRASACMHWLARPQGRGCAVRAYACRRAQGGPRHGCGGAHRLPGIHGELALQKCTLSHSNCLSRVSFILHMWETGFREPCSRVGCPERCVSLHLK